MEGLLTLKKITLYLVDRGRKFVRLWQLLEVLGFVAPVIPRFSVVMRGGDLQDENGPELAFRGAAMLYLKISWGEQSLGVGMPARGPDSGWWSLPQQGYKLLACFPGLSGSGVSSSNTTFRPYYLIFSTSLPLCSLHFPRLRV